MILAIDAGNSSIAFGTVEGGKIRRVFRIHTDLSYTSEEYGIKLKQLMDFYEIDVHGFEGAILSSVVPPVTRALSTAVKYLIGTECVLVGPGIKTGMNVRIDDPGTLAADLAVGSVAAISCYGTPAIVIEMGTATTMVVVDEKACYRGGAIMPGIRLGLKALASDTSLLPEISFTAPKKVIATNTVDAMRSGAVFATAAMIDGMIERMEAELGKTCRIIATGELANAIAPCCKRSITVDDNLILKGLWTIWEKNRK